MPDENVKLDKNKKIKTSMLSPIQRTRLHKTLTFYRGERVASAAFVVGHKVKNMRNMPLFSQVT